MSTSEQGIRIWWERLPVIAASAVVTGLFYSNIAMSLGMMVLLLHSFFDLHSGRISLRGDIAKQVGTFFMSPEWSAPVLVLVAVLVSGLWSDSLDDWIKFSRLKLPFLALPLAFYLRREWTSGRLRLVEQLFIGLAVFSTLPVVVNLALHYPDIEERLKMGQPIPTPTHHIRYGMLLAFASLLAFYRQFQSTERLLRGLYASASLWIFIVLLILSTRTGILVFMAGFLYVLIQQAILRQNWRALLMGAISSAALFAVGYLFIPTMQTRISYMKYDWERMRSGDDQFYSDSERMRSLQAGWAIWTDAPWTGAGMGDQKRVTVAYYKEKWDLDKHKLPHNQLLFIMTSTGLIGLLLFLAGTLYPFARALFFRRPELVILYIIFMLAGLVEHTLETTTGITMFCFLFSFYTRWYHTVGTSSPSS